MSNSNTTPPHRGRFQTQHRSVPLVEIDFAEGTTVDTSGWTRGHLNTTHGSVPLVEIDFANQPPVLVVTMTPKPETDPLALALGIVDILATISKLEMAMGGAGFAKVSGHELKSGEMVVQLDPLQIEGADWRMQQIVNRGVTRPEFTSVRVTIAA